MTAPATAHLHPVIGMHMQPQALLQRPPVEHQRMTQQGATCQLGTRRAMRMLVNMVQVEPAQQQGSL